MNTKDTMTPSEFKELKDALERMTNNRNAYKKSKDAYKRSYEKWKTKAQKLQEEILEKDEVLEQVAPGDYHTNPVAYYKALARSVLNRYV